jgi:hypothetical protein
MRRAMVLISAAEDHDNLTPSEPQISTGSGTSKWLNPLEERAPKSGSDPVGQSALGLGR